MVKNIWSFIFLLNFAPALMGQERDTVLAKMIETMDKERYEYQISYKLFKGRDGSKAYESYSGVIARDCNNIYQQLGPMEFVQTETFFVKLNHNDKEILIGEYQTSQATPLPALDSKAMLEHYTVDGLSIEKDFYILKLTAKGKTPRGMGKLILEVDKENFRLKRQVILMDAKADFSVYDPEALENDFDTIRLEISFSGYRATIDRRIFEKERYFMKEGARMVLGKEFADFEYITTY